MIKNMDNQQAKQVIDEVEKITADYFDKVQQLHVDYNQKVSQIKKDIEDLKLASVRNKLQ